MFPGSQTRGIEAQAASFLSDLEPEKRQEAKVCCPKAAGCPGFGRGGVPAETSGALGAETHARRQMCGGLVVLLIGTSPSLLLVCLLGRNAQQRRPGWEPVVQPQAAGL